MTGFRKRIEGRGLDGCGGHEWVTLDSKQHPDGRPITVSIDFSEAAWLARHLLTVLVDRAPAELGWAVAFAPSRFGWKDTRQVFFHGQEADARALFDAVWAREDPGGRYELTDPSGRVVGRTMPARDLCYYEQVVHDGAV